MRSWLRAERVGRSPPDAPRARAGRRARGGAPPARPRCSTIRSASACAMLPRNSSRAEKSVNDPEDSSRSIVLAGPFWNAITARRSRRSLDRAPRCARSRSIARLRRARSRARVSSRSRSASFHLGRRGSELGLHLRELALGLVELLLRAGDGGQRQAGGDAERAPPRGRGRGTFCGASWERSSRAPSAFGRSSAPPSGSREATRALSSRANAPRRYAPRMNGDVPRPFEGALVRLRARERTCSDVFNER